MKLSIEQQAALSETGSRYLNEDRLYPSQTDAVDDIPQVSGLYMVADGSGGQDKGNVAAKLAIREFARYIDTFPPANAQITYGYLSAALLRVEEVFHQHINQHPEAEGMATTIALMYADGNGVAIGWIGNSRVYHVRNGKTLFQTRDQMVIQDMVAHGKLSPEEAEAQKGNFTQARMIHGTAKPTDLDFHFVGSDDLEEGDVFLVCTDGVTREISDKEIQRITAGTGTLEDIKEEVIGLCKNESSDNFSAIFVELGEVSETAKSIPLTSSPPITEGGDIELDLNELEEPPVISEDVPQPSASTIIGKFGTDTETTENPIADEPAAGTLLERLQARAQAAEAKIGDTDTEAEEKDDNASVGTTEPEGKPRPDMSPEPRPGFLQRYGVPLLLGALLIAALGYAVSQLGGNEKRTEYQAYLKKATQTSNSDSVIHYGRKAYALADSEKDKNAAQSVIDGGLKKLSSEIEILQKRASYHMDNAEKGGYADLWRAQNYISGAILKLEEYPEEIRNPQLLASLQEQKDSVLASIARLDDSKRVAQLLTRAGELCEEGKHDDAQGFFDHADELIGSDEKLRKQLATAQGKCKPPVVADRGIDAPAKSTNTTIATKEPAKSVKATEKPVAANANAESTDAATVVSSKPTTTQLQALEKGIALFEKQRLSNSNYEAIKAAEYLEAAGTARTGAAAYMLAVLYNQGTGVKENQTKAAAFSKESALKGYPGGHFIYASLLLKNENPVDSTTARKSLNVAAGKGHPDATNLLYQLTQPAARLRP